jgi:hypothetical protein
MILYKECICLQVQARHIAEKDTTTPYTEGTRGNNGDSGEGQ